MADHKQLVAALRRCAGRDCDGCSNYEDWGCIEIQCGCAADAIEELMPKWISVKERQPDAYDEAGNWQRVLGYTDEGNMMTIAAEKVKEGGFVTHWLPLPEPPDSP